MHNSGKNEQVSTERISDKQVLVTYQPTLKRQAELSDGSVSGKFYVLYDIERFNDAGEILVRITKFFFSSVLLMYAVCNHLE
jgi:hypothetical protein